MGKPHHVRSDRGRSAAAGLAETACASCGRLFRNPEAFESHIRRGRNGQDVCCDPESLGMSFVRWARGPRPSWGAQPWTFWTEKKVSTLHRLVQRNWSDAAIARHFGVSEAGVKNARYRNGIRRRRPYLTPDQLLTIRQRLAAGERQADVARDLGILRQTVNNIARGRHWTAPPAGGASNAVD